MRIWRDAPTMIVECASSLDDARLISLDHDLLAQAGADRDPGNGLEVAEYLASYIPLCPVIIHTSNADRAWSMHNEFRFAGWTVDRVEPLGDDWIPRFWLPKVCELLTRFPRSEFFQRPVDHSGRMHRALLSLEGLAIGDALGEMLAYRHVETARIIERGLPSGTWLHTDDTEMALSIVEVLQLYGHVHQDALSRRFAWRYKCDPDRGYGSMTRAQFHEIARGGAWRQCAVSAFNGQGSMGNGGAMRVAPIGAYFADDLSRVAKEARASALVTHTHGEGIAGAIAVGIAAAMAWRLREEHGTTTASRVFDSVLEHTPEGKVLSGLVIASQIPSVMPVEEVAKTLGNGFLVTAPDTVPFAIWCAAHHLDNFVEALALTISSGGDCDTNAAIVGGIVALAVGFEGIPDDWKQKKEKLPIAVEAGCS